MLRAMAYDLAPPPHPPTPLPRHTFTICRPRFKVTLHVASTKETGVVLESIYRFGSVVGLGFRNSGLKGGLGLISFRVLWV